MGKNVVDDLERYKGDFEAKLEAAKALHQALTENGFADPAQREEASYQGNEWVARVKSAEVFKAAQGSNPALAPHDSADQAWAVYKAERDVLKESRGDYRVACDTLKDIEQGNLVATHARAQASQERVLARRSSWDEKQLGASLGGRTPSSCALDALVGGNGLVSPRVSVGGGGRG